MKTYSENVRQEIKALREIGVTVSEHAEVYALNHADSHEHRNVSEYVDMCITATS